MPIKNYLDFLAGLIACGGPDPSKYGEVNYCLDALNRLREDGAISLDKLRRTLIDLGTPFNSQIGRAHV